jgi:hypothetical protein
VSSVTTFNTNKQYIYIYINRQTQGEFFFRTALHYTQTRHEIRMPTLDELVTARLYDTKNITPETYESLILETPAAFSNNTSSNVSSANTGSTIRQSTQGTISKLHVLNWSTDNNDDNVEASRRGLFSTYGGEFNRGNIILLRDINVHGEQRLNGDMLHVVVP